MDKELFRLFLKELKKVFVFVVGGALLITAIWCIPYYLIFNGLMFIGVGMADAHMFAFVVGILVVALLGAAYMGAKAQ